MQKYAKICKTIHLIYNQILNYYYNPMQSELNGQQKKVIAQYINDTLSKYEIFQKQKHQQSKQYEDRIILLQNQLTQEKQKSELLEQYLNEMKDRYNYLKRQDDVLNLIRNTEKAQNDLSDKFRINDLSSIIEIEEEKNKDIQTEKNKIKRMLQESQAQCERLKQQNDHNQKQIAILTDSINQKQAKNLQKIRILEEQLQKVNNSNQQKIDSQSIKTLQKQKRQLESNLKKCTQVVKDMEQFYMEQIQNLKNKLKEAQKKKKEVNTQEVQKQMSSLQQSLKTALKSKAETDKANTNLLKQIDELRKNIQDDLSQISKKRQLQKQEFKYSQNLLIKTYQKKLNIAQEESNRRFQEYEDKINFLIIKLQQSNHPVSEFKKSPSCRWRFHQGMNLQDLSVCESQSISYRVQDSLRLDSSSISRRIKQNFCKGSKRLQLEPSKDIYEITPVKSLNCNYILSQRSNLM